MDEKDRAILKVLEGNTKMRTWQIAKKLPMPVTTVHNRIKKMEKEGIIKGYTVVLDHKKLGKPLEAYVLITVDYSFLKKNNVTQYELAKRISSHDFVVETGMVTGVTDIIAKIRASDIDEVSEFVTKYLRNIDGVEKTQTVLVLSSVK